MSSKSQKIEFTGSSGDMLAARLDMPDQHPRAYALFAHCFTCSKDIFAASRIAGRLADNGIAVLRFDFTGLGASEGEFANTNFSSNVEDLVRAAAFMRENYEAPQILIGHSLGGAAVLVAAGDIPEAKAVATIGAPADAEHVIQNFSGDVSSIEQNGEAQVTLAGRSFTIRKQFLDDVRTQSLTDRIAELKRALLVFHAPLDNTVGIENAGTIFSAAKHPKSFISLDDADHLLTAREDAIYVADVLASWSERYVEIGDETGTTKDSDMPEVRVVETGDGFQQQIISGSHELKADEPASVGGKDTGPSPYDYLSVALGACTSMTLRMYANHKKYSLGRITVDVNHGKVHAKDCADCGKGHEGRIDRFERLISIEGEVAEEIADRLAEIADKCPVHKTLEKSSAIVTRIVEPPT